MALLIDTNVIVRYLIGDQPEHLAKATTLFTQYRGTDRYRFY